MKITLPSAPRLPAHRTSFSKLRGDFCFYFLHKRLFNKFRRGSFDWGSKFQTRTRVASEIESSSPDSRSDLYSRPALGQVFSREGDPDGVSADAFWLRSCQHFFSHRLQARQLERLGRWHKWAQCVGGDSENGRLILPGSHAVCGLSASRALYFQEKPQVSLVTESSGPSSLQLHNVKY